MDSLYQKIAKVKIEGCVGDVTIRDYLRALLVAVIEREEGFSGKRPFGNSGWKFDIYAALIKEGLITGELDEYGYVEDVDTDEADVLLSNTINYIFDLAR